MLKTSHTKKKSQPSDWLTSLLRYLWPYKIKEGCSSNTVKCFDAYEFNKGICQEVDYSLGLWILVVFLHTNPPCSSAHWSFLIVQRIWLVKSSLRLHSLSERLLLHIQSLLKTFDELHLQTWNFFLSLVCVVVWVHLFMSSFLMPYS